MENQDPICEYVEISSTPLAFDEQIASALIAARNIGEVPFMEIQITKEKLRILYPSPVKDGAPVKRGDYHGES